MRFGCQEDRTDFLLLGVIAAKQRQELQEPTVDQDVLNVPPKPDSRNPKPYCGGAVPALRGDAHSIKVSIMAIFAALPAVGAYDADQHCGATPPALLPTTPVQAPRLKGKNPLKIKKSRGKTKGAKGAGNHFNPDFCPDRKRGQGRGAQAGRESGVGGRE